jgi:hypothetical protein
MVSATFGRVASARRLFSTNRPKFGRAQSGNSVAIERTQGPFGGHLKGADQADSDGGPWWIADDLLPLTSTEREQMELLAIDVEQARKEKRPAGLARGGRDSTPPPSRSRSGDTRFRRRRDNRRSTR